MFIIFYEKEYNELGSYGVYMIIKNKSNSFQCKKKFLNFFPKGFQDENYFALERTYKWETHKLWQKFLNKSKYENLLKRKKFEEICKIALKIESKTHLLFSFEKLAIRDALKTPEAQKLFANALFHYLFSKDKKIAKFEKWCKVVAMLPRKQTRVLTWPILTIFGYIAQPEKNIYFKPKVTRKAALNYGFNLFYEAPPSIETYASFLGFVEILKKDLKILNPKDLIDIQSFIWVQGSSEYDE